MVSHSDWCINASPHRVLGDNQDGPHSSAIIVGRRTVLACANSLRLLIDESKRNTKAKTHYTYLEDYWIQQSFTYIRGEITAENRIPLKLFKFNVDNDWALFVRDDNQLFAETEVATIDTSPLSRPDRVITFMKTVILHCPVSLKSGITKAEKFSVGCQIACIYLRIQSTHHVQYEGCQLCRGSSGGGVYIHNSASVLGMHVGTNNEADYDAEDTEKVIAYTDKRVDSKDDPIETSNTPATKKMKSDSEAIANIAGGNNELGSAIIICRFPQLMYYIEKLKLEK